MLDIQQYQNQPYNLTRVHEIQDYLENIDPLAGRTESQFDNDLYLTSQRHEPKNGPIPKYVSCMWIAC